MTKEKTLFAMDMLTMLTVEELSKQFDKTFEEMLLEFMKSNTAKMLYDDSTKLWWDGPSSIAEDFKKYR